MPRHLCNGSLYELTEHGTCTCCSPPRPVHRERTIPDDRTAGSRGEEWAHDDDEIFATVFHVHAHHGGTDCDGPMERSHTYQLTSLVWENIFTDPERIERGPDDNDLWAHLVRMDVPVHAESATVNISEGHMDWSERTDEGHRGGSLDACYDPGCAYDGDSQRDHYAERMGY